MRYEQGIGVVVFIFPLWTESISWRHRLAGTKIEKYTGKLLEILFKPSSVMFTMLDAFYHISDGCNVHNTCIMFISHLQYHSYSY